MKINLRNAKLLLVMAERDHKIESYSNVPKELLPFVLEALEVVKNELEEGTAPIRIKEKK